MSSEKVLWTLPGGTKIKPTVAVTFLLAVIYSTSFFMQITLLPYITKEIGLNHVDYGFLQTVFGVVQLIGGAVFGQICDTYGLRKAMLLAFFSTGLCYSVTFLSYDYWTFLVSRMVCVFMHGFQGAQTVIAAVTDGAERTKLFGKMGVVFGFGFILGPSSAGILSSIFGARFPLLVATGLCVVASFLVVKYIPDRGTPHENEEKAKESDNNNGLDIRAYGRVLCYEGVLKLFTIKNLSVTPLVLMTSVLSVYLVETFKISPGYNSFLSTYVGLWIAFWNGFGVAWLRGKFTESLLLRLGSIALIATYCGLCLFSDVWQMLLINPGIAMGMSLINVTIDSQLTSLVPKSEHGTTLGLSHAINSLTRTLAPMLAGLMLERFGFNSFGYFGVVCCGGALGLIMSLERKPDEKDKLQ